MVGNNPDFEDEWRCVEQSVRAFFHAKRCSSNDIEDLIQETAYQTCKSFSSKEGDFKKWVMGIARLVFFDYLKKKKRLPSSYDQSENPSVDNRSGDPESLAIATSYTDAIECEQTKLCVELRKDGYTIREIADRLDISKSQVHRLIDKYKEQWEEVKGDS